VPSPSEDIEKIFTSIGGEFKQSAEGLAIKLGKLRAFILDWDGVFNDGKKTNNEGSPFTEVDSMGLNMLRFSFYLKHGFVPAIFIVTGENNLPAIQLSKREHFNGVYIKMKNKTLALHHINTNFGLKNDETGFVYDDILDLGLAEAVSLRFYIKRASNPLLNDYVDKNELAEYFTGNSGRNYAVREISELCIGLLGNYEEVVQQRVEFSSAYQTYLSLRNNLDTQYFTLQGDRITEYSLP